jgi:mannosyltransferase OCH1-like enzyme
MILIGERIAGSIRLVNMFQDSTSAAAVSKNANEGRTTNMPITTDSFQRYLQRPSIPSLDELTNRENTNSTSSCPNNDNYEFVYIANRFPNSTTRPKNNNNDDVSYYKIPRIIHQTSKSRCLTPGLAKTVLEQWTPLIEQGAWSYYFHDDDAVDQLLSLDYPEFPHLRRVAQHCLHYGTVKADLWRYLVLYVYGGLYADLDSHPNYHKFSSTTTIGPHMEGFFVVEQYHMLSQYFMAMTPRHPLMYYAIQHSLLNLYRLLDTTQVRAAYDTGPHALHAAYRDYRRDAGGEVTPAGVGYKPVWRGTFVGTHNTTITVVGHGQKETEWVIRESIRLGMKKKEYARMGMRHFKDDLAAPPSPLLGNQTPLFARRSCIRAMLPPPPG